MTVIDPYQASLIEANRREYGLRYEGLIFPGQERRIQATGERAELLQALAGLTRTGFAGTKLDVDGLSPGCRLCGEGAWSCLFINGRCNVRCFYCPSAQEAIDLPATNALTFRHPEDYVAYLERFGFRGASLSGGEPLLTPRRTLAFLRAIKKRFGDALHLWLYTNGTLVERDILCALRDAGLDEIRFDIGAIDYRLDKARLAVGVIPTVTVEIPAVPEEFDRMREKIAEMADAGIAHLNLHQLRLTPFNYDRLAERGYTFLHGEKVTVLESELTALRLLLDTRQKQIPLPINYCSFVFKNRFQKASALRRAAGPLLTPQEELTPPGYIRRLSLTAPPDLLARQAEIFGRSGESAEAWSLAEGGERLLFHPRLWPLVDPSGMTLRVAYFEAALRQTPSRRHPFAAIPLTQRMTVLAERATAGAETSLDEAGAGRFGRLFLTGTGEEPVPADMAPLALRERIAEGLAEYF